MDNLKKHMNSRIQELIEQATTKEEFYPAGCNGYPDYRIDFNKEKFAELIIKKCIEIAVKAEREDAPHFAWFEIQKHFGVEE